MVTAEPTRKMAQVEDAQFLLKSTDLWSSALYLLHDDDDVIELKKTEASMHEKVKKPGRLRMPRAVCGHHSYILHSQCSVSELPVSAEKKSQNGVWMARTDSIVVHVGFCG